MRKWGSVMDNKTHEILLTAHGLAIKCLVCGRTSYNQKDVSQKYCSYCAAFHEHLMLMRKFNIRPKSEVGNGDN